MKRGSSLSRIALCVALALGTVPALAQNTTSIVAGRVTAPDGKPVAGANVSIVHVESGSVNTATTDSEGRYHARGLRAGGPYTITVTKDGVSERRQNVFLDLAETNAIDLRIVVQARETVVVTGQALPTDVFEANNMGATTQINRAAVESLPSIQRNLQDLARVDPRVSQTDKERGEISVAGQNSRYNKITIDGVNISDTFGLEANTMPTLKQPVSIDAIQSVQVNVSNYDVTHSGYVGGNINAVTKSGTNDLSGSLTYVYRDDKLAGDRYNRAADTYTDPPKFKEKLYGATLGGPIIKDKVFFFLGFEELRSTRNAPDFGPIGGSAGGVTGILPSSIEAIRTIAQQTYNIDTGVVNPAGSELLVKDYLAKLDWNINRNHRANVRFTRTEQSEPMFGVFSSTALSTTTHPWQQVKKIDTLVAQWFADWSQTLSTELKVSRRDYHSEPTNAANLPHMEFTFTGPLPAGSPPGTQSGTRTLFTGTERSRHFNILDTITDDLFFGATWTRGDHEIKALVDYTDNKIYNAFLQDTRGNYDFRCINSSATFTYSFGAINCGTATAAQIEAAILENFRLGRPNSYRVQVPLIAGGSLFDGVSQFHIKNQGFGLQDTWSVNPNLTLMFGVRVDTPVMPNSPLRNAAAAAPLVPGSVSGNTVVRNTGGFGLDNTDTIDGETLVQPRFGFNYRFPHARPTQLRGGVGLFQGAAANVWLSNIFSNTGVAIRLVGCGTAGFANCQGAGSVFSPDPANQRTNFAGAVPAANVDFLDPGLGQPSVWKGNLAFEHQLPWFGMVASLEYLATKNKTAIYYEHLNLGGPTRTGTDGRPLFYTPVALVPTCWNSNGTRITTGACADGRTRALANASFADALLAKESSKGKGQLFTGSLAGRFMRDWSWNVAYTYTEQTEVSGLTSSVAFSNWRGRASFNPNAEEESNSAYLTKDRINASLMFERAFFRNYKTRIGLFYEGRSGKPYSWTYANDINGDGQSGNDLMFIPRAPGSGDVIFLGGQATEDAFWAVVNQHGSLSGAAGGVVERNSAYSPWTNSIDVRLSQEIPSFFPKHKAMIAFDILNFGNLLNKRWGRINEMAFRSDGGQTRSFVNFVGIDPASGKYIYNVRAVDDLTTRQARGESQWAAQITLRYEF